MRTKFVGLVASMAVLAGGVPMIAHHSFAAEFDATKGIKLTGAVTKVEWMNPHTYFYIDVTEICQGTPAAGGRGGGGAAAATPPAATTAPATTTGTPAAAPAGDSTAWKCAPADKSKVPNWGLEMGSPNGLMRQGWTRNSMKIGDEVTVEGSAAKDGSNIGNARSVTLSTGTRLFAASSQAPANP
jgi:hypothetical protein